MTAIHIDSAPAAIGPYCQAMRHGDLLFISGQLPIVPATGAFVSEDPVEQMAQCLANIAAIAEAAGTDIAKSLKLTILVTDLSTFPALNDEYAKVFSTHKPARACYEVLALPKGAQVEIDAIIAV